MIGRPVVAKLAAFTVVTVLGAGYILLHYMGLGSTVLGRGYTAYVDLASSGGLFPSASVTYRGVEVGRVGALQLSGSGIRATLNLNGRYRIPADSRAVVGNGSAIGEQYLDLQPPNDDGPYLHAGSVIPVARTTLPVTTQDLLVNVDKLVNSIPRSDLRTLVTELGAAFDGTGPALQRLLDASHQLLTTATANLPATVSLLNQSVPVLDTQAAMGSDIVGFAQHLSTFTDQLRASDADLRRVLAGGVGTGRELADLVRRLDVTFPVTLGNLLAFSQPIGLRLPALQQFLIGYPYVIATTFGLFPGDGTVRFGIPVPGDFNPQPCEQGYISPKQERLPSTLPYPSMRWNSFCRAPTSANVLPRGSRMAPEPGGGRLGDDPSFRNNDGLPLTNGPTASSPSPSAPSASGNAFLGPGGGYSFAGSAGPQQWVGANSWMSLILGPLTN